MDSAEELYDFCRDVCFRASNLGFLAYPEHVNGKTAYTFQSAEGVKVSGDFFRDRKEALKSVCTKFNEQVKTNG